MKRTSLAVLTPILLTLGSCAALAQAPPFPQTLPANTVVGRLGVTPGPAQAIPTSTLAGLLAPPGLVLMRWSGTAWTTTGPLGASVSCAGSTTSCLQEAINYTQTNGYNLRVECPTITSAGVSPAVLGATTTVRFGPATRTKYELNGCVLQSQPSVAASRGVIIDTLAQGSVIEWPTGAIYYAGTSEAVYFNPTTPDPQYNQLFSQMAVVDMPYIYALSCSAAGAINAGVRFSALSGAQIINNSYSFAGIDGQSGQYCFRYGMLIDNITASASAFGQNYIKAFIQNFSQTAIQNGTSNLNVLTQPQATNIFNVTLTNARAGATSFITTYGFLDQWFIPSMSINAGTTATAINFAGLTATNNYVVSPQIFSTTTALIYNGTTCTAGNKCGGNVIFSTDTTNSASSAAGASWRGYLATGLTTTGSILYNNATLGMLAESANLLWDNGSSQLQINKSLYLTGSSPFIQFAGTEASAKRYDIIPSGGTFFIQNGSGVAGGLMCFRDTSSAVCSAAFNLQTAALTLGNVGSGSLGGSLIIAGSSTGSVTQTAQATAGSPAIVWGTSSGTPAVTASAPLAITAATGNITCGTCVTGSTATLSKTNDTNVTMTLTGTPTGALLQTVSLDLGWTGTLSPARGGHGVANNAASTLTISGAFATTFTLTNTTSLTLPTSGTLITLAGSEALTNKTYNGLTITSSTGTLTISALKTLAASASLTLAGTDGQTLTVSSSTSVGKGQYLGTATNDSATAGNIGEYTSATGGSSALTTGVALNVTSVSLTAGDWDAQCNAGFTGGGTTTMSYAEASVSTTSATIDGTEGNYAIQITFGGTPFAYASPFTVNTPVRRLSLSGTTTVYCVAISAFAVSTASAQGILHARRVR